MHLTAVWFNETVWRKHDDQRGMQPSQVCREMFYEACGSAVAGLIITPPEGLNLGRCRPNFLSTPAKVAAASW